MTRDDDTELDPELRRLRTKLRTANDKYRRAMQVEKKLKRRVPSWNELCSWPRRSSACGATTRVKSSRSCFGQRRRSRSCGRAGRSGSAAPLGRPCSALLRSSDCRSSSCGSCGTGESDDSARAVAKVQRHAEEHRERLEAVRAGSRPAEEAPHTDEIALPRSSVLRALRSGSRPRVAMIVDDFTRMSIEPECEAIHLTPGRWREELESGQPHLLFVESAWRGIDNVWENQVGHLPRSSSGSSSGAAPTVRRPCSGTRKTLFTSRRSSTWPRASITSSRRTSTPSPHTSTPSATIACG